jgi:hypothetical protein
MMEEYINMEDKVSKGGPGSGRRPVDSAREAFPIGSDVKHNSLNISGKVIGHSESIDGKSAHVIIRQGNGASIKLRPEHLSMNKIEKGGPGSGRHPEGNGDKTTESAVHSSLASAIVSGLARVKTLPAGSKERLSAIKEVQDMTNRLRGGEGKIISGSARTHAITNRIYGKSENPKDIEKGGPGSGRHSEGGASHEQNIEAMKHYVLHLSEKMNDKMTNSERRTIQDKLQIARENLKELNSREKMVKGGIGSGKYAADDKSGSHGYGLVKRLHKLHGDATVAHRQLYKEIQGAHEEDPTLPEKKEILKSLSEKILKIRDKLRDWEVRYPANK